VRAACANWSDGRHGPFDRASGRVAPCCSVPLLMELRHIDPCVSMHRLWVVDGRAQTVRSLGWSDRRWPCRRACRMRRSMKQWKSGWLCRRPGRWEEQSCQCTRGCGAIRVAVGWTHRKAGHLVSSIPIEVACQRSCIALCDGEDVARRMQKRSDTTDADGPRTKRQQEGG
jgi:hypothetical protein